LYSRLPELARGAAGVRDFSVEKLMDSKAKATLSFSDGRPSVEFPIYGGTIGPDVIDVRSLYAKTGAFTCGTAAIRSSSWSRAATCSRSPT
jgi:citrate synthase